MTPQATGVCRPGTEICVKIGFVGLGRMGQAMAHRLLEAGCEVLVFNRTPEKTKPLAAAGAAVAESVAEAASAGVVVTMLSDDDALQAVGQDLVESLPADGVHVAMGTHGVAAIRTLAATHRTRGQHLIAAPMLGRPEAVAAGAAGIVAAGPAQATARCAPLFAAIGRRTFDAGEDPVAASAVKIANNFLLGSAIAALGEAFVLVEKSGVDAAVFQDVVADGLFACPAYVTYGRTIAAKSYDEVGFTARLALKDVTLALAAAEAVEAPLPTANVWRDRLLSAIAHGDGERDWAVMTQAHARAAGLA